MGIYQKPDGKWYASKWRHPKAGEIPAHSLRTRDRDEAEARWAVEQARALAAAGAVEAPDLLARPAAPPRH